MGDDSRWTPGLGGLLAPPAEPDRDGDAPLANLSSSQRIAAAREMANQIAVIVAAVERGEIGASMSEVAQLQGALVALRTVVE